MVRCGPPYGLAEVHASALVESGSSMTRPEFDDVWVIVPCFNEARVVGGVINELRRVFPQVIGVDDGSADDSAAVMRTAGAWVVRHAVNLGQGAALQTGMALALTDECMRYAVTFDADGQHRVADAADMLRRARTDNLDVVLGSRFLGASTGIAGRRALLLRAGALFDRLTTGIQLTDSHNGLRVLSRAFVSSLDLRLSGMAHASEILGQLKRGGLPYAEHPVTIDYTPYSIAKGQRSVNAVNIALDVWVHKLMRGGRS